MERPELNKIYCGDVLEVLKTWPDNFVDCIVTSPPYWGLRDYGTAKWEGGNENCDHKGKPFATKSHINEHTGGHDVKNAEDREFFKEVCGKCGAKRIDAQLGLEKTPEEYVAKMVEVFRECKRVLKKDGTLWLNLGDSYNGSGKGGDSDRMYAKRHTSFGKIMDIRRQGVPVRINSLKPKDLVGIPWRVAFALQADGWYLRQDIIWAKPNPMPESVTDRCTKSHEYIFLLTKSGKYYFDNDAIKEPVAEMSIKRAEYGFNSDRPSTKNNSMGKGGIHVEKMGSRFVNSLGRNKRSVWTITTKPYMDAHFATFPQDLIIPMIRTTRPDAIILDPFMGSGTTAYVARSLGRKYLGIELNPDYIKLADKRLAQKVLF